MKKKISFLTDKNYKTSACFNLQHGWRKILPYLACSIMLSVCFEIKLFSVSPDCFYFWNLKNIENDKKKKKKKKKKQKIYGGTIFEWTAD